MADDDKDHGGVWPLKARIGRPKPYGLQWREWSWDPQANNGQGAEVEGRKTEFFATEKLRDERAAVLRRARARGALTTVNRGEIEEFRAYKAAIGSTPWQEVVNGWRSDLLRRGVVECAVSVAQAADREIDRGQRLVDAGKMSRDGFRHKKRKLTMFKETFGLLRLDQVRGADIEAWVDDMEWVESGAAFNKYVKQVRCAFRPYVDAGVIGKDPCASIRLRDESTDKVGINTPQEMAVLFNFAMRSDRYKVVIGRLALEAFVGLRFASGSRIEKADINFENRGILLPAKKLKTGMVEGGKRHYIDGVVPAQVWEWLAITPDECWSVEPRRYLQLKTDLFADARVAHPHNTFRHSFCTYDVAVHKSASRTAYILGHQDENLVHSRYKGVQAHGRIMTESDGRLYQSLTPKTVAKVAKGYMPPAELSPPAE